MKKPNIEDVYLDGPTTCAAINGKLINAKEVSEMIDALIMAKNYVEIYSEDLKSDNTYVEIIDTLKKAGCEL